MRITPVPVLSMVVLVLIGGLASLWVDESGHVRNVTWTEPMALSPDVMAIVSPGWMTVAEDAGMATITDRPVFAPDRRPPPPPLPPAPPDPMANVQIQGVFSGQNAGVLARVDGKIRRVKLNETIGSWTLKTISGRDVIFVQGEETRELHLAYVSFGPPSAPVSSGNGAPVQGAFTPPASNIELNQSRQDEAREILKRRNQARAAKGLPLLSE